MCVCVCVCVATRGRVAVLAPAPAALPVHKHTDRAAVSKAEDARPVKRAAALAAAGAPSPSQPPRFASPVSFTDGLASKR